MIERAFRGSAPYFVWIGILVLLTGHAIAMFWLQLDQGLSVTAMSRDVPWGFYIAQLTFLVGIAASAVMVVLPYYLHDYQAFGQITILGEFLAIPAVLLCPIFVLVDLGQPSRVFNLFLHPTLNSMLFWDTLALLGYLVLNVIIGWKSLQAQNCNIPPPTWIRLLVYLSIPWAFSIHTVTAFLYSGLAARPFWLTAVLAPRFLASAFASGPALLIILCLIVRRCSSFDPGEVAIRALARIVTYAMLLNVFLFGAEIFTALYSGVEDHIVHLEYLFVGIDGKQGAVVPFMRLSVLMALVSLMILLVPKTRYQHQSLFFACVLVFVSIWIDKGAGMLTGGFIPSPMGTVPTYFPSQVELLMGIGLYAFGALVLTLLYKVAVSVKEETGATGECP